MKTEIVKQINVKFEKDEKDLIKKVVALINDLIFKGIEYEYHCYDINGAHHDTYELENLIELLNDLAYTEVIELTQK